MIARALALRWTIGDVAMEGFEALRLSVWGAYHAFGDAALYAIGVNTLAVATAKERTGQLPPGCAWHEVTHEIPSVLSGHLDPGMAEGVAWKLAPLRMFPNHFELSLDNDCILWEVPQAIRTWLEQDSRACVLAGDVRTCFGQFASECGDRPRNAGIRGLPPGFDVEHALSAVLACCPVRISSELDEQGLQVAALSRDTPPLVVGLDEVSICSPFPPHLPYLGRSGAHFCGLNAKDLGWRLDGRAASDIVREHWRRHRPHLYAHVGLGPASCDGPDAAAPSDEVRV